MKNLVVALVLLYAVHTHAQVDEIKSASTDNSAKSGRSDRSSVGGSGGGGFFVDFFFGGIVEWQRYKLNDDRTRYPSMVSLDVMMQGAIKPSSYYILWPRIRGTWGLFATDFRMNYLIEEDADGYKHIRTNDWQIVQLNLVTSRFFTFRLGTGFMQEAFGANRSFSETAFLLFVHAPDQTKNLGFEYRFSKDWDTGANPRREFSIQYQHELFSANKLHGYATLGGVYQRYYNAIEVWGIQAGFVFRLF
jgi:hypothetical protein